MPSPPIADTDERQRRFEEVYVAHRGPILGYVLRRTGNPDDAADVIAETFLTAWRRLEDIPRDAGARLWLYGVARRVLANHHRGERPARYRAEFASHHLNITLKLVPASPSVVGTVVYIGESAAADITPITAQGKCFTGGGGSACPVGVRIPADFRGQADLVFGRAARPGEHYESTAPATAPGEVMHGLRFQGQTVAQVLALLRERGVTVPVFNYAKQGYARNLSHVPGTWYVYDATPWAPRQVMLMVGPTRTPALVRTPQPGTPIPSPTS